MTGNCVDLPVGYASHQAWPAEGLDLSGQIICFLKRLEPNRIPAGIVWEKTGASAHQGTRGRIWLQSSLCEGSWLTSQTFAPTCRHIHLPVLGYPMWVLGKHSHKVGYPKKGYGMSLQVGSTSEARTEMRTELSQPLCVSGRLVELAALVCQGLVPAASQCRHVLS